MTKVIIVVESGRVTNVYTRNKNIECELVDLDTTNESEYREKAKRLLDVERSKTYKDIL